MKVLRNILFFLLLPAVVCAVSLFFLRDAGTKKITEWSRTPIVLTAPVFYEFKKGTSLAELAEDLYRKGLIDNHILFRIWVRFLDDYKKFQAGPYRFEGQITPHDIALKLREGDVFVPVVFQITVPEGFTADQIFSRLVAGNVGNRKEYEVLFKDPAFLKTHNIPSPSLEGYLFPATYSFTEMPVAKDVLTVMIKTFWERLPEGYEAKLENLKLSLHDAVTMASLIELETRFDDEREKVSEVIWARLKKGVPLGIDASIIYGIPDYDGNLRFSHLRDKTNPYNSRIHGGLPPTPIGSPSTDSIKAVVNPTDHGYFYYVVDLDLGGRHHFSSTLKEHNSYVRKLVRDQKRAGNGT